jgi:hypothetical protein
MKILFETIFNYGDLSTLTPEESLKIFQGVLDEIRKLSPKQLDQLSVTEMFFKRPGQPISRKTLGGRKDIFNKDNGKYDDEIQSAVDNHWTLIEIGGKLTYKSKDFSINIGNKLVSGTDYVGVVNVRETGGLNADVAEKGELWKNLIEIHHKIFNGFYKQ